MRSKMVRGGGGPEELIGSIRTKFVPLKEEVDSELGVFAGDLVGALERGDEPDEERRLALEDLLVAAQRCAEMSPEELWARCEGIVQGLDDRRQELPAGFPKQAHTRILFILTRCTRLLQFCKELAADEGLLRVAEVLDRVLASFESRGFSGERASSSSESDASSFPNAAADHDAGLSHLLSVPSAELFPEGALTPASGSLPPSPLLTPRSSHAAESSSSSQPTNKQKHRGALAELENFQQIESLLAIARGIESIKSFD